MESGFNARAVDYARFGYLFAHEGRVGDRQVVPAAWVAEATARDTSADPAEHYQYWWWVDTEREGRFSARGNKGQYVYVDPATDVVVVRMGREYGIDDWPAVLRRGRPGPGRRVVSGPAPEPPAGTGAPDPGARTARSRG